jgi:predicted nucleotidyltransferase
MYFEKAFKALNDANLKYVVIGGVAVNLHGFSRATADLDIVISLCDAEISKFIKAVIEIGLAPRVPVKIEDFADASQRKEWVEQKNMKVFSVYHPNNPMEHIDVMIDSILEFEEIYGNRIEMQAGPITIPVASITDLIKLKQDAGRDRDLMDIKALRRIQKIKENENA